MKKTRDYYVYILCLILTLAPIYPVTTFARNISRSQIVREEQDGARDNNFFVSPDITAWLKKLGQPEEKTKLPMNDKPPKFGGTKNDL